MKIALINDVHIGPRLEFQGKVRAFSHLAENSLAFVIKYIVEVHKVDLLINLGDLIRSEDRLLDLKRYAAGLHVFKTAPCPVLHLLGNHELKKLSLHEIETLWHQNGFTQDSFGVMHVNKVRLIWLGLEVDQKVHRLPQKQLDWFEEELERSTEPTIVLTHCAMDDQDLEGNFFYETFNAKDRTGFFLENKEAIKKIIRRNPCIIAVVQAHLHQFKVKLIKNIPFITIPAMGDNICAPGQLELIPEIYSIITYDKGKFIAKAYSREYCFAGYED